MYLLPYEQKDFGRLAKNGLLINAQVIMHRIQIKVTND